MISYRPHLQRHVVDVSLKTENRSIYPFHDVNETEKPSPIEDGFSVRNTALENAGEEEGRDETDQAADDDFAYAVPDTFLEAGELGPVHVELLDEHVEISALVAEIHPDAGGIIDKNEGECGRDGKGTGADALIIADARGKGDGERGMCRRHMSVREHVFRLPAMLHRKYDELDRLGPDAYRKRNQEDEVGVESVHRLMYRDESFTV